MSVIKKLCFFVLLILLFTCIGCSKDEDTDLVVFQTSLSKINIDGSNLQNLVVVGEVDYANEIIDGKILFQTNNNLFIFNIEDNLVSEICEDIDISDVSNPLISQDRTYCYFIANSDRYDYNDLYRYNFAYDSLELITTGDEYILILSDISMDEEKLLFEKNNQSQESLVEYNLLTNQWHTLINDSDSDSWVANPKYKSATEIYYLSYDNPICAIKKLNVPESSISTIIDESDPYPFDISPDKSKLCYTFNNEVRVCISELEYTPIRNGRLPKISNSDIIFHTSISTEGSKIYCYNLMESSLNLIIDYGRNPFFICEHDMILFESIYQVKSENYNRSKNILTNYEL